jgi:hypothetical protein
MIQVLTIQAFESYMILKKCTNQKTIQKVWHKWFSNASIMVYNLLSFPQSKTQLKQVSISEHFIHCVNKQNRPEPDEKVNTLGTCSTVTDLKFPFSCWASLHRPLKFWLFTFQEPSNCCKTNKKYGNKSVWKNMDSNK